MVGNVVGWTQAQWQADMQLAKSAHIDAFALNIAWYGDESTFTGPLALAFAAANAVGFKLFISFDYTGGTDVWPEAEVISVLQAHGGDGAYYNYNGPFASTFEGPDNAEDWKAIKAATGCFLIPDWSSVAANVALSSGVADGLFNWAAWPWGAKSMDTYIDASFLQYLNSSGTPLPYMMPVSPWFYTNLPGYDKNWAWRGDDLWFDRWQEVMAIGPNFVEILTWNDYGESHYVGPLHDEEYDLFTVGKAPFNFASNMPHEGWLLFLPFLIDTYKNLNPTITQEGLVSWHRLTPALSCSNGDTVANTASQLQIEFEVSAVMQDRIFYDALLIDDSATVVVSINGVNQPVTAWSNSPDGGIGLYHGSVPFTSGTVGPVVVTLLRGSTTIATVSGSSISNSCPDNGLTNWNPWVGGEFGGPAVSATPTLSISEQACVAGTGAYDFADLCEFSCSHGYCPIGACTCLKMGKPIVEPAPSGAAGYPVAGKNEDYDGLCAFDCSYGHCPADLCGPVKVPLETPASSPFLPPACTSGTGLTTDLNDLCEWSCTYGYCPIRACTCLTEGVLVDPPKAISGITGYALDGSSLTINDLCKFACKRGHCTDTVCGYSDSSTTAGGSGGLNGAGWLSPESATVIPFSATTVAPTATFTIGGAVTTNINAQPNDGNQNVPQGPGADECDKCDLARLITSTCCGTGGGVSNPIEIAPNTPIPRNLILPLGFIPNQQIVDIWGSTYPAGTALAGETIIGAGTVFPFPFEIPAGLDLSDIYTPGSTDPNAIDSTVNGTMYIITTFWTGDHTIYCNYPCVILFPPITSTTTYTPSPFYLSLSGSSGSVTPPVQTTELIRISKTTVTSSRGSSPTKTIVPIPAPKPLCIRITVPFLGTVTIGWCPPKLDPFPPSIVIPPVTILPVPPGSTAGPVNPKNVPTSEQEEEEKEEDEEDQDQNGVCPFVEPPEIDSDEYDVLYLPDQIPDVYDSMYDIRTGADATTTTTASTAATGAGTGTPKSVSTVYVTITASASPPPVITVTQVTVVTPKSVPTVSIPSPSPNPEPPTPDPSTEVKKCFKSGREILGSSVQDAMDSFCSWADGTTISGNDHLKMRAPGDVASVVVVSVYGLNNCEFKIEEQECKRIFDQVKGCKHYTGDLLRIGGQVTSNCAIWTLDPQTDLGGGSCIPIPLFELFCELFG